jgi:hypothetical protein
MGKCNDRASRLSCDDFSDAEIAAVRILANGLQRSSSEQLDRLLAAGVLKEICHAPQTG